MLLNTGVDDTFRLALNPDASIIEEEFFQYAIAPTTLPVTSNSSAEITVQISVAMNAPIGLSVTFTLSAQSTTNVDASDYITFDMVTTREVNPIIYIGVAIEGREIFVKKNQDTLIEQSINYSNKAHRVIREVLFCNANLLDSDIAIFPLHTAYCRV